jgi:hypothetical protein
MVIFDVSCDTQVGRWAALRSMDVVGYRLMVISDEELVNTPFGRDAGKREFGAIFKKALTAPHQAGTFRLPFVAGWSSLVARQAHNLKVVGSNPTPAPNLRHS